MPRHGIGIDISTLAGSEGVVTTIDDFVFESFSAGQMHPILTTSRTNLIPYSEDFSNAAWTKDFGGTGSSPVVTSNQIISPDGTLNADKIVFNAGSGTSSSDQSQIFDSVGMTDNASGTASVHLKGENGGERLVLRGVADSSYTLITLTTDWQRFSTTENSGTNSDKITFGIRQNVSGLGVINSSATVYAWGAQLEQDGFATEYIPTSGSTVTVSTTLNDTSNVWDFDGTDIEITEDPEDEGFWEESYPDGASLPELVLNGDYEELGSELVTDGSFPTGTTAWTKIGNAAIQNGYAELTFDGTTGNQIRQGNITSGKIYKVQYEILSNTGTDGQVFMNAFSNGIAIDISVGTYTVYLTAINTTFFNFRTLGGTGGSVQIDNVSVKQVDPNSRWTLSNTTISDGALTFTDNSSAAQFAIYHDASLLEIGSAYEITLTVNKTAGGVLKVLSGAGASALTPDVSISSSGTQTFRVTNDTNGGKLFLYTTASENFQGTVDNVSVKEYAIQPLDI